MDNISNFNCGTDLIQSWAVAIGLQQVDGLTPSMFLELLAAKNINGEIDNTKLESYLARFYKVQNLTNKQLRDNMECDIVSNRIVKLLNDDNIKFSLDYEFLKVIHKYLFKDLYSFAGTFRDCNLVKNEEVLDNNTVIYADKNKILEYLIYDFETERNYNYKEHDMHQKIKHFAKFTRNIWQAHPFREGNTRTISVFLILYLRYKGYNINQESFQNNAKYFRDALSRSNYQTVDIEENIDYLVKFFENILLDSNHVLESKDINIRK